MTIGGTAATTTRDRFEVRNPSTGAVVNTAPNATAEDLDRAITVAHAAQPAWAARPDEERAALAAKVAETILAHAEELAQLLTREQGKPLNGLGSRGRIGTRIGVMDLDGGDPRWIETEAYLVFHFANGFERGSEIVIDYVRHAALDLGYGG